MDIIQKARPKNMCRRRTKKLSNCILAKAGYSAKSLAMSLSFLILLFYVVL